MIEVKILGQKKLAGALDRRFKGIDGIFKQELSKIAIQIQNEAVKGIAKQSRGRIYKSRKNKTKSHIASKPGDPPNTDTGRLVDSIQIDLSSINSYQAIVGTGLIYGKWLELGTQRIAPRPWLKPASQKVAKKNKNFSEIVAKSILRKLGKTIK